MYLLTLPQPPPIDTDRHRWQTAEGDTAIPGGTGSRTWTGARWISARDWAAEIAAARQGKGAQLFCQCLWGGEFKYPLANGFSLCFGIWLLLLFWFWFPCFVSLNFWLSFSSFTWLFMVFLIRLSRWKYFLAQLFLPRTLYNQNIIIFPWLFRTFTPALHKTIQNWVNSLQDFMRFLVISNN